MSIWILLGMIVLMTLVLPKGEDEPLASIMLQEQADQELQMQNSQLGGGSKNQYIQDGGYAPPTGCAGQEMRHRLSLYSNQPCRQPSCLNCGVACERCNCERCNCEQCNCNQANCRRVAF